MKSELRLQKALADLGLGSRREIEGWIAAGRITVNGRVAILGQRLAEHDAVLVDGKPIRVEHSRVRVVSYNKPEGEICSRSDPEGRPSVFESLPRLRGSRWITVGRLDLNTSGLLLATNWGELANRLMHPGREIEREYVVRVLGTVDDGILRALREGVLLEDGIAAFDEVREQGGAGSNRWFSVVLREGRNREVRRLWESQGLRVSRLKRVRYGCVSLSARERVGMVRELGHDEIKALCALVDLRPPRQPETTDSRGSKRTPRSAAPARRLQQPTRRQPRK